MDVEPWEWFRVLFIQDFFTAMGIYAVCFSVSPTRIGYFLRKGM